MLTLSKRIVAALALACGLSAMLAVAVPGPAMADDKDLAQALRAGGLVIVIRHGATFPDQVDAKPIDFDNITAQRNLNDKGKAAAAALGEAFRQIGVPVGKVYTSRFNRAYETATLAGFKQAEKITELTDTGAGPGENTGQTGAF